MPIGYDHDTGDATPGTTTGGIAGELTAEIAGGGGGDFEIGAFVTLAVNTTGVRVEEEIEVGNDTVVCIVEAMKVFNEIPAGVSGQVVAVLVENGAPVEFGQPLFRIQRG